MGSSVEKDMTSIMEAAAVVDVSIRLWSGYTGPKKDGNVWWSAHMIRDHAFYVSLARDVKAGVEELRAGVEEMNEEIRLVRRMRADALEGAELVLNAVRAARLRGLPWQLFEKCIAGQTPRKIIRMTKNRPGWSIMGELQNWVMVVDAAIEPARIEGLLTLRRQMA